MVRPPPGRDMIRMLSVRGRGQSFECLPKRVVNEAVAHRIAGTQSFRFPQKMPPRQGHAEEAKKTTEQRPLFGRGRRLNEEVIKSSKKKALDQVCCLCLGLSAKETLSRSGLGPRLFRVGVVVIVLGFVDPGRVSVSTKTRGGKRERPTSCCPPCSFPWPRLRGNTWRSSSGSSCSQCPAHSRSLPRPKHRHRPNLEVSSVLYPSLWGKRHTGSHLKASQSEGFVLLNAPSVHVAHAKLVHAKGKLGFPRLVLQDVDRLALLLLFLLNRDLVLCCVLGLFQPLHTFGLICAHAPSMSASQRVEEHSCCVALLRRMS